MNSPVLNSNSCMRASLQDKHHPSMGTRVMSIFLGSLYLLLKSHLTIMIIVGASSRIFLNESTLFFFCESMVGGMPGPLVLLPLRFTQGAGLSIRHCFSIISANVNSVGKAKNIPVVLLKSVLTMQTH